MNQPLDRVLRCLCGDESTEATTLVSLQKLADENPYFPVAQLLLAKKLKSADHIDFTAQAQKTALYFSNPLWLHYQLSESSRSLWHETDENAGKVIEANEKSPETNLSGNPELHTIINQPTALNPEASEYNNAFSYEKELFKDQENQQVCVKPAGLKTDEVQEETNWAINSLKDTAKVYLNRPEAKTDDDQNGEALTVKQPFWMPSKGNSLSFNGNIIKENSDNKEHKEADEHERMFQNIKAMLDATSEEVNADAANTVIPLDPYYTIDYFASQGIRLQLEQNPGDQLGQHLKKFTQWLKNMKKLGPEDAAAEIAHTETEADIQQIAASSNTVREVVTEAMACVLEKQGKKEKAITLYNKLIFLNPDKSAYFAAKINSLKGI